METGDRIAIDPAVCHGRPFIRGTRVPVSIILGSLAGGMSFEDVAHEYDLTHDDIRAAIGFAGEVLNAESFHTLPTAAE